MNQTVHTFTHAESEKKFSLEAFLTADECEMLFNSSNIVEYSKRDVILKQNSKASGVPFILSGLVKISREMRKGKNIILKIVKPEEFIGLPSVFASDIYDYSVTALEPTTLRFIDIDIFRKLIRNNGTFAIEIIKQVSCDNIFNIHRLSSLLYKQLPGRVADLILYFSEEIYKDNSFMIPLTRQELAELAGTTKESLIRTLSEFKHDKIIDMNRNYFSINSINIIKTLSRLG